MTPLEQSQQINRQTDLLLEANARLLLAIRLRNDATSEAEREAAMVDVSRAQAAIQMLGR